MQLTFEYSGDTTTESSSLPWPETTLGEHLSAPIKNGYSPVCPTKDTGMWTLSLSAVTIDGFNPKGAKPAPSDDAKASDYLLQYQDILVSRSNTPERVGLAGIYKGVPENCFYPDLMMRVRLKESLLAEYLLLQLLAPNGRKYFSQAARGSSGSMVKIDRILLENFLLPLPPLPEQKAIAKALSDVDALITSLDQLIAKKRAIKQGAMQQLLTGKTRLPGFDGEWKDKRLGELLSICHGKSQHEVEEVNGPYPILATGGQIGTARTYLYNEPSVLIGRKGTIDRPQYMNTPFWTVDTLFYSVISHPNSAKFIFYQFCMIEWRNYNEASGVPSLNARTIENIKVCCPPPKEQKAIAQVLTDMDTEITTLETRRDKTKQLKQGMMQELLTGRTRLV
jgi:type I restriction enzyme S subunit